MLARINLHLVAGLRIAHIGLFYSLAPEMHSLITTHCASKICGWHGSCSVFLVFVFGEFALFALFEALLVRPGLVSHLSLKTTRGLCHVV